MSSPEIILTCDTSSRQGLFSLCRINKIACELVDEVRFSPIAEEIAVQLESLLQRQRLSLDGISKFAITRGPGSFTGLRIGYSALKVWAHLTKRPLVGVSTLKAMACSYFLNAESEEPIGALLYAGTKEYYVGAYRILDSLTLATETVVEDQLVDLVDLKDLPSIVRGTILAVTEDFSHPTDLLDVKQCVITPMRGDAIAKLAIHDKASSPIEIDDQPFYLRLSEAERRGRKVVDYRN